MGWKQACCSCSLNIRLALDVLEIICCNIIHFAMEGTRFYFHENSNNYKMGEFIWYGTISSIGFLAQFIVLIKVVGCTLSNHFLRLFYIVSSLLLLSMATIVTAISYAERQPDSSCSTTNMTLDDTKSCLTQAIAEANHSVGGKMSATQFGFEFAMFIITALTGFLFIYSFILTFCKPKLGKADKAEELTHADNKPSWPPSVFDTIDNANHPSEGDNRKEYFSSRPNPSAPPLPLGQI